MANASLQGSLDSFKLPEILTFLSTARKTGTLVVESTSWKSSVTSVSSPAREAGVARERAGRGTVDIV